MPGLEQFSRRHVLAALGLGAVGVAGVGAAVALDDEDSGGGSRGSAGEPRTIEVYGGADSDDARAAVLQVWARKPRVAERGLSASYNAVASRSSDQFAKMLNLLREDPGAADLLVVDAEYLPALIEAGQIEPFPDRGRDWLLGDLGCVANVADRCLWEDELYAVPLNTDVPMLAFDDSRIADRDRPALRDLGQRQGAEFWTTALQLAQRSTGEQPTRRLLLQNGEYEGFTACLTELVAAFGPPGGAFPAGAELDARLAEIAGVFGRDPFELAGDGDEDATLTALQKREAVAARLWPSQCHSLTAATPGRESGAPTYTFVPIPGGVLGGQVIAAGRQSPVREQAQELAVHLAEAASQVQLHYNGGYVPTLAELYGDEKLRDALYGVGAEQIGRCVRRPVRTDYLTWSDEFRERARTVLLGG